MDLRVICRDGALRFERYPFPPASVRREPDVAAHRFTAWKPGWAPPTLVLEHREVLFVSAEQREEVDDWATRHAIARPDALDVWDLLLDPFLDTEHDEAWKRRCVELLLGCGFAEDEIEDIRRSVSGPMLSYNALLWEWVHLGHYDVLNGCSGFPVSAGFSRFYWESMGIALRGFPAPA